eukprot:gene738-1416_t
MDNKLMRDFEELEGLGDPTDEELANIGLEEEEQDDSMRPHSVMTLNNSEIYAEMEQRNLKTTGFPDTDREMLQREFDKEFNKALDDARARRREGRQRAARQRDLQRRRVLMETMLQEEQNELVRDYQTGMMIDLIKDNMTEASIRVDVNSISARGLAKAMWSNHAITCLDLSSNSLNDHSGSYLARILKRNKTIIKLELDNNQFSTKTCQAFGEALKVNDSLVYLSLDSNPLTAGGTALNGFMTFAESLRSNETLRSLNLWRTNIGAQAGSALSKALQDNDTLLFCDIGYCGIDMIDIKMIADKKDRNLAAYEREERGRRAGITEEEMREKRQLDVEETMRKQKDLAQWLESRRDQRAESRRKAEKERDRRAAEEAEAKKKKKKAKAKAKK